MKKYSSKARKWVSEEEYERLHKPRDKKLCRGGKPHDFVLVLPSFGVRYNQDYKFNPEVYYKMMEDRFSFIEDQREQLLKMGIETREWNHKPSRTYICSVCKKQKYDFN